ncbi:AKAP7 2'5' RNA ligase-like domain-containing protein [Sarocladium implicatum]|nr:AKAP7 2'5' RNA ligase-like domain-containing protein [Sarocladium implicatum]
MPRPPPLTHFLSIHLGSPQLARSLAAFAADVTSPNGLALAPAAIRPLGTMHLTLGVMSLPDDDAVNRAKALLRSIKLQDHLRTARASVENDDEPLKITLRGLHALHDPAKTTVVYAPPEDDAHGTLYKFCSAVRGEFEQAGLVKEEKDRPLLLHATVVNTIYVPGQRKGKGKETLTIDARGILDGYDGFTWLEGMEVDGVRLCKMGAKEVGGEEGQRYEVEDEVKF